MRVMVDEGLIRGVEERVKKAKCENMDALQVRALGSSWLRRLKAFMRLDYRLIIGAALLLLAGFTSFGGRIIPVRRALNSFSRRFVQSFSES